MIPIPDTEFEDIEPSAWMVFHVWMESTNPAKYKFFIVLSLYNKSAIGIIINSRINTLGESDRRLPCFAKLLKEQHTFLNHDSWADCTRTFTVPIEELTDLIGLIHTDAAQNIRTAVLDCPMLKNKTKKILSSVELPYEPE